jgi:hypothetical protein
VTPAINCSAEQNECYSKRVTKGGNDGSPIVSIRPRICGFDVSTNIDRSFMLNGDKHGWLHILISPAVNISSIIS